MSLLATLMYITHIFPHLLSSCLVQEVQALMSEIELLRVLRHERIVQYYGTERKPEYLCIFMEYVSGVRTTE